MKRREKWFWVLVGVALLIGFFGLISFNGEICEKPDNTGHKECAAHNLPVYLAFKIQIILDALGVAITALATIAIAWFTLTLRRSTDKLWDAGERQLKLAAEASAAQSRDMRDSIAEARRSGDVAERALVAANRPWIKLDIVVGGPIRFDVNGANITLRYIMTNIGHSPALNVMVSPRLVFPIISGDEPGNFDPRGELRRDLADHAMRRPSPFGYALFPGDVVPQDITVSMGQEDIERATKLIGAIYPTIIGFVEYRMGFDDQAHRTGFMVEVSRNNAPRPSTTEKNRSPSAIWVDEGDVPAQEVRIFRTFIDGGYAD